MLKDEDFYPPGLANDPSASYNQPIDQIKYPEYEDDIPLDDEEPLLVDDEII